LGGKIVVVGKMKNDRRFGHGLDRVSVKHRGTPGGLKGKNNGPR